MEKKTNYEITRDNTQDRFLQYDQQHMIEKFGLVYDERYLYIEFVGHDYRIDRTSGYAEWSEDGFLHGTQANYNEALSIYDVLCCSKEGCCLSGHFTTANGLPGTAKTAQLGDTLHQQTAKRFDHKIELFSRACETLGGKKGSVGDVDYLLHPFEFLPMRIQFWDSDEEFPANLKIMWDENTLDYVHYETTYLIAGHVFDRLLEIMEDRV